MPESEFIRLLKEKSAASQRWRPDERLRAEVLSSCDQAAASLDSGLGKQFTADTLPALVDSVRKNGLGRPEQKPRPILFSPSALSDLDEIWQFVRATSDEAAATRAIERVADALARLSRPRPLCHGCIPLPPLECSLLLETEHCVIYYDAVPGRQIRVLRVLHMEREILKAHPSQ